MICQKGDWDPGFPYPPRAREWQEGGGSGGGPREGRGFVTCHLLCLSRGGGDRYKAAAACACAGHHPAASAQVCGASHACFSSTMTPGTRASCRLLLLLFTGEGC